MYNMYTYVQIIFRQSIPASLSSKWKIHDVYTLPADGSSGGRAARGVYLSKDQLLRDSKLLTLSLQR